jgi:hypothetical protein
LPMALRGGLYFRRCIFIVLHVGNDQSVLQMTHYIGTGLTTARTFIHDLKCAMQNELT